MKPTQSSGECDLNTFLYDVGSTKVGDKPVFRRGILFHVSSPDFIQYIRGPVHVQGRNQIFKNSIRRTCSKLIMSRVSFLGSSLAKSNFYCLFACRLEFISMGYCDAPSGKEQTNVKMNYTRNCLKGHLKIRIVFKPSPGNVCSFNFNYFLLENGTNETEYLAWFRRTV